MAYKLKIASFKDDNTADCYKTIYAGYNLVGTNPLTNDRRLVTIMCATSTKEAEKIPDCTES